MAEQEAEAGADKYKGHKRPHELIPDYIKDREKIDVSVQLRTWDMQFLSSADARLVQNHQHSRQPCSCQTTAES